MLQQTVQVVRSWFVQTHISVAITHLMRCNFTTVISMCYQRINKCCNRPLQRHFRQRILNALVWILPTHICTSSNTYLRCKRGCHIVVATQTLSVLISYIWHSKTLLRYILMLYVPTIRSIQIYYFLPT